MKYPDIINSYLASDAPVDSREGGGGGESLSNSYGAKIFFQIL